MHKIFDFLKESKIDLILAIGISMISAILTFFVKKTLSKSKVVDITLTSDGKKIKIQSSIDQITKERLDELIRENSSKQKAVS